MKKFKGRPVISGTCKGKAIVSKRGFNVLASYMSSLTDADGSCVCGDINNKELYGRDISNCILCIPQTIGSTSAGFMIQSIAAAGLEPKAILYARPAEPLALAGLLVADIWDNVKIITIDSLGNDFIETVQDGDELSVDADGTVTII